MKRLALITVILGSALALVPVASAAPDWAATHTTPSTPFSYPHRYHGMEATEAVLLRSQGLEDYYSRNAENLRPDILGGDGNSSSSISTGDSTFDWGNVLAITLAGMLLLGLGATTMTRRHQPSF